jgi:diguanylate cyclase (GGDEF)-like protein/PAS domain S-box-containing protein
MVMPGLQGLALIKALREKNPDGHIMVMTGFPDKFPYVAVVEAGGDDFIAKPILFDEIEAKLIRIFKERALREELLLAERKYRNLFELSMNGMALLDSDGYEITDVNQAFCDLSGYAREDLAGRCFLQLLGATESERVAQGLSLCAEGGRGTLADIAFRRADGIALSLDVSITFIQAAGDPVILLAFKDMTDKRAVEQQLATLAQTDEVTNLGNRRTFYMRLEWALAQARRDSVPLTLMLVDLDGFKDCNDQYGHQAGDMVLKKAGELIRRNIRANGDEGFRYGGDELAVLLFGVSAAAGARIGERMRAQFERCALYGTTMSIGVGEYVHGMGTAALVSAVDAALYKAKSQGRNAVCVA